MSEMFLCVTVNKVEYAQGRTTIVGSTAYPLVQKKTVLEDIPTRTQFTAIAMC